jgi:hypothetical protein
MLASYGWPSCERKLPDDDSVGKVRPKRSISSHEDFTVRESKPASELEANAARSVVIDQSHTVARGHEPSAVSSAREQGSRGDIGWAAVGKVDRRSRDAPG